MQCIVCNEDIHKTEVEFGDVVVIEEEYWHRECYAEYFGEEYEEVEEVATAV